MDYGLYGSPVFQSIVLHLVWVTLNELYVYCMKYLSGEIILTMVIPTTTYATHVSIRKRKLKVRKKMAVFEKIGFNGPKPFYCVQIRFRTYREFSDGQLRYFEKTRIVPMLFCI